MSVGPDELARLLTALGRAGIELAPHPTDPARLRHRPATLPPQLLARLRAHRGAVVGLLASGHTPDHGEAAYVYAERLGVADGLAMPTHPGSPAWLVAVGESMGIGCQPATYWVCSRHGEAGTSDRGCGEGERRIALRDRQGRGRGP